jgi:hypothetical protein
MGGIGPWYILIGPLYHIFHDLSNNQNFQNFLNGQKGGRGVVNNPVINLERVVLGVLRGFLVFGFSYIR